MGLDMYLYKADNEGKYNWREDEIGYWRKANQIHAWFVENVQNGIDECEDHEVTREQVEELYDECVIVSKNKQLAGKRLPVQGGFFFGSTDYDEWYFQDIKSTIKILKKVLNEFDFENNKLIYCSSW